MGFFTPSTLPLNGLLCFVLNRNLMIVVAVKYINIRTIFQCLTSIHDKNLSFFFDLLCYVSG